MITKDSFLNLASASRMAILLETANIANKKNMLTHPETFNVCEKALNQCRSWLRGEAISPDELARYIDAESSENPWMQESVFRNDLEGLDALIFVTMVIAHVAHFAYLANQQERRMSEAVSEAGLSLVDSLMEYGKNYGLFSSDDTSSA